MTARDDWLPALAKDLERFAAERDWGRFHSPKNLAMALVAEAGELLSEFQWLSPEESAAPDDARRERIESELADVLIYLVRLSDRLGVDLVAAAWRKLEDNRRRYPAERVRGDARKYDEY